MTLSKSLSNFENSNSNFFKQVENSRNFNLLIKKMSVYACNILKLVYLCTLEALEIKKNSLIMKKNTRKEEKMIDGVYVLLAIKYGFWKYAIFSLGPCEKSSFFGLFQLQN